MENKRTIQETAVMKYYVIYEQYHAGNYFESKFVCIVEHEEIAKDFCKKNHGYYYEEVKIENDKQM